MARLTDDELAAWVAASCRRCDVPVHVTESAAIPQWQCYCKAETADATRSGGRRIGRRHNHSARQHDGFLVVTRAPYRAIGRAPGRTRTLGYRGDAQRRIGAHDTAIDSGRTPWKRFSATTRSRK